MLSIILLTKQKWINFPPSNSHSPNFVRLVIFVVFCDVWIFICTYSFVYIFLLFIYLHMSTLTVTYLEKTQDKTTSVFWSHPRTKLWTSDKITSVFLVPEPNYEPQIKTCVFLCPPRTRTPYKNNCVFGLFQGQIMSPR